MKIKQGSKVKVTHARQGTYEAEVVTDFETLAAETAKLTLLEDVKGLSQVFPKDTEHWVWIPFCKFEVLAEPVKKEKKETEPEKTDDTSEDNSQKK